jgi:hypothetical protein
MSVPDLSRAGPQKIFNIFGTESKELADLDSSEARLLPRGVVAHPSGRYAKPFRNI